MNTRPTLTREHARVLMLFASLLAIVVILMTALAGRAGAAVDEHHGTSGRWYAPEVTVYAEGFAGTGWKINAALREWNTAGPIYFRRVTNPANAEVTVRQARYVGPDYVGATNVAWADNDPATRELVGATVLLVRSTDVALRSQVAVHEFGHVVGLGHDDEHPASIMNTYVRADVEHVSDVDRDTVQRLYRGEYE